MPIGRQLCAPRAQWREGAKDAVHAFMGDDRGRHPCHAGPQAKPAQGQSVGYLESVRFKPVQDGTYPAKVGQDAVSA
jgi:hypothetical protein